MIPNRQKAYAVPCRVAEETMLALAHGPLAWRELDPRGTGYALVCTECGDSMRVMASVSATPHKMATFLLSYDDSRLPCDSSGAKAATIHINRKALEATHIYLPHDSWGFTYERQAATDASVGGTRPSGASDGTPRASDGGMDQRPAPDNSDLFE